MRTMAAVLLHGLLAAGAMTGTTGPAGAGSGAANADTDGALSGIYTISFHPEVSRQLPPGAMLVCRARVLPAVNGVQPGAGFGRAPGNQSGCALEVPFVWAANRPQPAATLSYEVDEVGADGRLLRAVTRNGVALPEAAAGAARRIDVAF